MTQLILNDAPFSFCPSVEALTRRDERGQVMCAAYTKTQYCLYSGKPVKYMLSVADHFGCLYLKLNVVVELYSHNAGHTWENIAEEQLLKVTYPTNTVIGPIRTHNLEVCNTVL